VATTNANESRARDRFNDLKGKTDYKTGYYQKSSNFNRTPKENRDKPGEFSFKQGENGFRSKDSHYSTQEKSSRSNMPRNKDFRTKDNSQKGRDIGSRNTYSFSGVMDKEDDKDIRNSKGHKAADLKSRGIQRKDNDLQPDKLETIKRLEREKKVIQKKSREEEIEKPKHLQNKPRKIIKDWTKGYEYGLLDDEADYSEY
jgi:hypothetical protein